MERFPRGAALLLVDIQNDFCAGGALAVAEADEIIPIVNRLIPRFEILVATQDWHPHNHSSFKEHGGPWPPHCVQHTRGAELHPGLDTTGVSLCVRKGASPDRDDYSEFEGVDENGGKLDALLKSRDIDTVYVVGLATDYCVRATVLDALRNGYRVLVFEDGIKAVNVAPGDGDRAIKEMAAAGAHVINSKAVLDEQRTSAARS